MWRQYQKAIFQPSFLSYERWASRFHCGHNNGFPVYCSCPLYSCNKRFLGIMAMYWSDLKSRSGMPFGHIHVTAHVSRGSWVHHINQLWSVDWSRCQTCHTYLCVMCFPFPWWRVACGYHTHWTSSICCRVYCSKFSWDLIEANAIFWALNAHDSTCCLWSFLV